MWSRFVIFALGLLLWFGSSVESWSRWVTFESAYFESVEFSGSSCGNQFGYWVPPGGRVRVWVPWESDLFDCPGSEGTVFVNRLSDAAQVGVLDLTGAPNYFTDEAFLGVDGDEHCVLRWGTSAMRAFWIGSSFGAGIAGCRIIFLIVRRGRSAVSAVS